MSIAEVKLWGKTIGAVTWDLAKQLAYFEYDSRFADSGIQVAPLMMPLSKKIYSFPELSKHTFQGLPGMLSDSLPDKFGNALIDRWLAEKGRDAASFNPVERLCYVGKRGMGALEYLPTQGPEYEDSHRLEIDALVKLASQMLTQRQSLKASFEDEKKERTLRDIFRVGTSAGGARAKAIIAWNPKTNEVRSGQVDAGEGFSYWLLKFDGVQGNEDKGFEAPKGYGLMEYAYHKMACAAGIEMNECRLLKENGRSHFMTKRFDRDAEGRKTHLQSLCALAHFDYNLAGGYSYEQVFQTIKSLGLKMETLEEQLRRMTFNILARNQDDHAKNIAFMMNKAGEWRLSPAFDLTHCYNPTGTWTATHQISLNGKRDDFEVEDFVKLEKLFSMKRGRAKEILREVGEVILMWADFAEEAGVPSKMIRGIQETHRLDLIPR